MVSSPALDVFQKVTERGWYELPTHGPEASSWSLCSNPHMWKRGLHLLGRLTQMKPDARVWVCVTVFLALQARQYLQCIVQRCDVTHDRITGRIIPEKRKNPQAQENENLGLSQSTFF